MTDVTVTQDLLPCPFCGESVEPFTGPTLTFPMIYHPPYDRYCPMADRFHRVSTWNRRSQTVPKGSVEKVARAICAAENGGPIGYFPDGSPMRAGGVWHEYSAEQQAEWQMIAQAALAALNLTEASDD